MFLCTCFENILPPVFLTILHRVSVICVYSIFVYIFGMATVIRIHTYVAYETSRILPVLRT